MGNSTLVCVLSAALGISSLLAIAIAGPPVENGQLETAMSDVAKQLKGQSGKSARATFISNSISKITSSFIPSYAESPRPYNGPFYVLVYDAGIGIDMNTDLQLNGAWYDVSDLPYSCTKEFKNVDGKCIQRELPQMGNVQFDGATFTAVVFAHGHFNKCGKPGGSDIWGFTFDGPFPPSPTDTTCTSGPSSSTAVDCTARNRCYIIWPCKSYCSYCEKSCCCAAPGSG